MIFLSLTRMKIVTPRGSLFILSLLFSSVSLWPIMFWSTNITHSSSIFLCGLALFLCYLQEQKKGGSDLAWAFEGLSLGLIILCNPLYLGVSTLFAITRMTIQFKRRSTSNQKSFLKMFQYLFLSVLLPILYFFTISQPNQSKNVAYGEADIKNILVNLDFYSHGLSTLSLAVVLLIFVIILYSGHPVLLDYVFAIIGVSVLIPVLVQSNQRYFHYLVVPTICFGLIFCRNIEQIFQSKNKFSGAVMILVLLIPVYSFDKTKDIRAWYLNPGMGRETKYLLNKVNYLVPSNSNLCVNLQLDIRDQNFIIAGLSGSRAFAISPVDSPNTLFDTYTPCADDLDRTQILITKDDAGRFEAEIQK